MIFTKDKLDILNKRLKSAKSITIVAHKSPDGDSIGSSLALYHYLLQKGINNISVCHPDPAPNFLHWLSGITDILTFNEDKNEVTDCIINSDIIFCLDFNALHRVGDDMKTLIEDSNAFRVMIDHHLNPTDEFDLTFSQIESCSTAQLIFDLIDANNDLDLINNQIGEAIYCGIMTDSGSFRYPSTTAHTHRVIAELLSRGVDNSKVHESTFDTNTIGRLRLHGYAINEKLEILEDYNTAIMSLSEQELKLFDYQNGYTEGLVNVGLSIVGINKSIFLKESNGIIKISFRSKGKDNPINILAAKYFNGGGHANASGGKWEDSIESAIKKLKEVLPEFCK